MRHEEMDDLVDDTLLNPDYDPEADALPEGGIDELMAFMDEDEDDEPANDFGFPDSEVTKGNLVVGEDITKSQPGPMDVHTAVGMFDAKKKKRKRIGKSFDEIYKAAKSGYGPGKNPNSHKKAAFRGARDSKFVERRVAAGEDEFFVRRDLKQSRAAMKMARTATGGGATETRRLQASIARSDVRRARGSSAPLNAKDADNMVRSSMYTARRMKEIGAHDKVKSAVSEARRYSKEARKIRSGVGKSFDEIMKAKGKSGYGPGKNPNSHKKKALGGLAGTAKDRMKESEEAARIIEGGFASNGRKREVGFAPKGHDSLSEWKNTDKGGKKAAPTAKSPRKGQLANRSGAKIEKPSDANLSPDGKYWMGAARKALKLARQAKDKGDLRAARAHVGSAKQSAKRAVPAKKKAAEAKNFRDYLRDTHKGNLNPWAYD